jgi:hypothetical protein
VKALFVARLFPADIDVQLTAKITALVAATGRKHTGLQAQKEGSAGLEDLSRRITATMKELRPLMVRHLRDNDPKLLAGMEGRRAQLPPARRGHAHRATAGSGKRDRQRQWNHNHGRGRLNRDTTQWFIENAVVPQGAAAFFCVYGMDDFGVLQ